MMKAKIIIDAFLSMIFGVRIEAKSSGSLGIS